MERQISLKENKLKDLCLTPIKKSLMQSEIKNLANKRLSLNNLNNSNNSNNSNSDCYFSSEEKEEKSNKKNTNKKPTEENINLSELQTSIFKKSLLKNIVSKNKIRFSLNGFDLDLTYITDNIIAMGFPADNYEKIYRNSLSETLRFFSERHKDNYKIYNLCSERTYPENSFFSQGYFPFDDHEAPPFNLIYKICIDIKNFLEKDPLNVIAIHCKAGKGRTGTIICSYLLYAKICENAEKALAFYSQMRTYNNKGVTIPSQIRYVNYFDKILKSKIKLPLEFPKVFLKGILFNSIPNFGKMSHNCTPYFKVFNNSDKNLIEFKKNFCKKTFYLGDKIEFLIEEYIELKGDVKIVFYSKKLIGKEKMFKFWFNTFFIPFDGILTLKKKDLDKACKDKQNLFFFEDFKIDLIFSIDVKEFEKKKKMFKDVE